MFPAERWPTLLLRPRLKIFQDFFFFSVFGSFAGDVGVFVMIGDLSTFVAIVRVGRVLSCIS